MSAANDEIRAWARANGEQVSSRGNLPNRIKEKFWEANPDRRPPGAVQLLPSPEEAWAADDDYDVIGLAEPEPEPQPPPGPRVYEAVPDAPQPPTVDSGPAHGRKDWRKDGGGGRQGGGRAGTRKITVTVRTDISAKISLALEVPGRVWQARDPVCGGAFIEQRPAISDALTEIVCNSPDLVAWFAGQGGQFMLWFNLVMVCWPVVTVAMAHHVYHTVGEGQEDMVQPDYQDYAA